MVALRDENSIPDRNCIMDLNSIEIRISDAIDNQIKLNINHSRNKQTSLDEVSKIEVEHRSLNQEFDRIGQQLDKLLASLTTYESSSTEEVIVIDDEELQAVFRRPSGNFEDATSVPHITTNPINTVPNVSTSQPKTLNRNKDVGDIVSVASDKSSKPNVVKQTKTSPATNQQETHPATQVVPKGTHARADTQDVNIPTKTKTPVETTNSDPITTNSPTKDRTLLQNEARDLASEVANDQQQINDNDACMDTADDVNDQQIDDNDDGINIADDTDNQQIDDNEAGIDDTQDHADDQQIDGHDAVIDTADDANNQQIDDNDAGIDDTRADADDQQIHVNDAGIHTADDSNNQQIDDNVAGIDTADDAGDHHINDDAAGIDTAADDADIQFLGIVDESSNEGSDDDASRDVLPDAGLASPNCTPIKDNYTGRNPITPLRQLTILSKQSISAVQTKIPVASRTTLSTVSNAKQDMKSQPCNELPDIGLSSPDSSNSSGDDELLKTTMHITPKKNEEQNTNKQIVNETVSTPNTNQPKESSKAKRKLLTDDVVKPITVVIVKNTDKKLQEETVISQPVIQLASRKSVRVSSSPFTANELKEPVITEKHEKPTKADTIQLSPSEKSAKLLQTIYATMRSDFSFEPNMKVLCKAEKGDIWVEGTIVTQIYKRDKKIRFKVKLSQPPFEHKILLENFIAPKASPRRGTLYVGSRVIAERPYETIDPDRAPKFKGLVSEVKEVLYGGIVAEMSCDPNAYRYLIIYDDGFAQYIMKRKMFKVPFPATNVWEDLPGNMQMFMKEYLEEYPMRPMLKVEAEQTIVTEWNGNWLKAKVLAVDCSLVKVLFEVDNRTELIYRGSSRLEPLMNELDRRDLEMNMSKSKRKKLKLNENPSKWESDILDMAITRHSFGVSPYSTTDPGGELQLQYWQEAKPKSSSIVVVDKIDTPTVLKNEKRRLSSVDSDIPPKKISESREVISQSSPSPSPSTSSSCSLEVAVTAANQLSALMLDKSEIAATSSSDTTAAGSPSDKSYRSRARYVRRSCSIDEFKEKTTEDIAVDRKLAGSHECSSQCSVKLFKSQKDKAKHNHLAIPMLLGWTRESVKRKPGYHRDVYYRAPCKRRLRNIDEVARYLVETNTKNVSINQFCFDSNISCRDHNSSFPDANMFIPDLSGGLERVPVQCVNEVNDSKPPPVIYSSSRLPSQGVVVNTDPGFLSCCSCTDDCLDKTKCECSLLALDGARIISNMKYDETIGYQYRRLFGCLPTGLYECNQNCSCSSGCFNRVIQNGISLRLQIFMTESKGWGLRCLDDVPEGAFICTYAGHILNEEMANREGTDFGDEYLAELDHIESVEIGKEGYEATVPELESGDSPRNSGSSSPTPMKRMRMNDGNEDSGDDKDKAAKISDIEPPKIIEPANKEAALVAPSIIDLTEDTDDVNADAQPKKIILPKSSSLRLMIDKLKSQVKVDALPVKRKIPNDPSTSSSTAPAESIINEDIPSVQSEMATHPIMLTERVKQMIKDSASPRAFACKSTSPVTAVTKLFSSPRSSTGSFVRRRMPASTAPVVVIPDDPEFPENNAKASPGERKTSRRFFGEDYCYVIDAKSVGNAGRYINHSCSPNLFVQNIFVDTHDLRFPWVAFFAQRNIPSLTELTWDYSYDVGSVRDKIIKCNCGSIDCRGRLL